MSDAAAPSLAAAEAAQAGAGIIAARHRGDLASASALLEGLDDRERQPVSCWPTLWSRCSPAARTGRSMMWPPS